MQHPITQIGQFAALRGRHIKYTTNGGRTWEYALILNQPQQSRGGKVGYEVACEVRGRSHQHFFFTDEVLCDPSCIVQEANSREVRNRRWARPDGTPNRYSRNRR